MKTVTIHEAKTHLSRLLAGLADGEEVVVCKGSQPIARIVPLRPDSVRRPKVDERTSRRVKYSKDCFAPLSDHELEDWGMK
ncbi:MAG: type II toxin-antitoxin system prevent-host-death family antitoxin [Myxococcales bacterium]|nr:type II toxin-antitoxin system prevent-host-death family antitoxin [Myxococcales bacterium]